MFPAALINSTLYQMAEALPLVVIVSLVYAATRHEEARPILKHALHLGLWILGFMTVMFAVLWLISWWL